MIVCHVRGVGSAMLVAIAASLANAAPLLNSQLLTGYWYSEFGSNVFSHSNVFSLVHRRPDGSFNAEFLICSQTDTVDQLETGHWSLSGNRLIETVESIQGKPEHLTAVYDPVEVANSTLVLRISGGDALKHGGPRQFQEVRVFADAKLPGCHVTS